MEGKSGINLVLTIVAALVVVLGVVLCILFGVGQSLPGLEDNVAANLYIGLGAIGVGLIMLIGCNIATNARIAADNTYDMMYRLGLLCRTMGCSEEDLKVSAAELAKGKKKAKKAGLEIAKAKDKEAMAQAAEDSEPAVNTAPITQETEAPKAENEAKPEVAENNNEPTPILNCGIAFEDWKQALKDKIRCKGCGEVVGVHKTKKGVVVLMCAAAKDKKGCDVKPMPVEKLAELYLDWYNALHETQVTTFDLHAMCEAVESMNMGDGTMNFVAKM